jgi:hypothetical protein
VPKKLLVEDSTSKPRYLVLNQVPDEWPSHVIEITDAEMADYQRASQEFSAWQERLAKMWRRGDALANPSQHVGHNSVPVG